MEFASLTVKKMHILRIDPGEDVLDAVKRFLKEANVKQAVMTAGYGTLAKYHLHWVASNRLPIERRYGRGEGGIEVLALNGIVVDGEPHLHVALGTPEGAFGGHLEPGCIVYALFEAFFAEVEGVTLSHPRVHGVIEGIGEGDFTRLLFNRNTPPPL
ncbi:MAG: PPC domain-containing DNA-binding protein [Chloroflexota bacterium]